MKNYVTELFKKYHTEAEIINGPFDARDESAIKESFVNGVLAATTALITQHSPEKKIAILKRIREDAKKIVRDELTEEGNPSDN